MRLAALISISVKNRVSFRMLVPVIPAEFLPNYYNYFNHLKADRCPYWDFPEIRSVSRVNLERHANYSMFRMMSKGHFFIPGPRQQ